MAHDRPFEGPLLPSDDKATRVGRYVLVERIGAGETGALYRARPVDSDGTERTVVVKWFHVPMSAPPISDARIWAWLGHPNLVQVHELGEEGGRPFLVMEHLQGKCLRSLLVDLLARQRRLPVPIALCVAAQVARGLVHAQARTPDEDQASLAHIEVTPSNIMVLHDGGVKLLDSGILGNDQLDLTILESGPGNSRLSYGAPERLLGKRERRSDLFSLGVVLWESLIGRSLFRAHTPSKTLANVLRRVVPPPSHFRAEVPTALDRVVLQALERAPEQRQASAEAFADELERLLDADPRPSLASLMEELAVGGPVTQTPSQASHRLPLPAHGSSPVTKTARVLRAALRRGVSPAVVLAGLAAAMVSLAVGWLLLVRTPARTVAKTSPSPAPIARPEARPRSLSINTIAASAPSRGAPVPTPAQTSAPAPAPAPVPAPAPAATRVRVVARPAAHRRPATSPPRMARAPEGTTTIDPFAAGEAPTERPGGLW
jgi:serine/threonine-protein kinase